MNEEIRSKKINANKIEISETKLAARFKEADLLKHPVISKICEAVVVDIIEDSKSLTDIGIRTVGDLEDRSVATLNQRSVNSKEQDLQHFLKNFKTLKSESPEYYSSLKTEVCESAYTVLSLVGRTFMYREMLSQLEASGTLNPENVREVSDSISSRHQHQLKSEKSESMIGV